MKKSVYNNIVNNSPVRVAVVMGKHVAGGIKSVIMNYYRFINREKIQFDFIVDKDSPIKDYSEIFELGGKVYEVTSAKNPLKNILEIYKVLKKNNYLIIHGYLNTLNVFSMFAGFLAGTPIRIAENLSTAHSGEKKSLLKKILKPFACLFPTHISANSKYSAEWLYGKKKLNKVKIFYNALDLKKYVFDNVKRDKVRKKYNLENAFVIGHIGRYQYQKNHDFLIDIFNEIYKKDSSARLLLVGHGDLKEQIFEKIYSLNLEDVVIDCGGTEDIIPLYNAMDCFVLPSYYEGLPVVGIEAQATGLPCVMSTEVTAETKVTNNVEFIDLNKSASEWADQIIKWKNVERSDTTEIIKNNGYDIITAAKELCEYYCECLKKYRL